MISTFRGQSADHVWQEAAERFSTGRTWSTQPRQPGRPNKGNPSRWNVNSRPAPEMGSIQDATA